jgi:ATP-dependent exoDNAse (exonuclease V) beta subunit
MRLLARIEESAHNLNAAAQRFMLSDTQTLLHEIIGDDDAPFIFEKIGSRLKHVMIDEFQDTSTVQWKNFQTLLKECMSISNETDDDLCNNLIVGDVK